MRITLSLQRDDLWLPLLARDCLTTLSVSLIGSIVEAMEASV